MSSLLNALYLCRGRDPDGLTISGPAFSSSVEHPTVILSPADLSPDGQAAELIRCPPSKKICVAAAAKLHNRLTWVLWIQTKEVLNLIGINLPWLLPHLSWSKGDTDRRQGTWWVLMGGFQVCLAFLKLLRKNKNHYLEWNQFPGRKRKKAEDLLLKIEIEPRWKKKAFSHLLARCSVHINVSS